MAAAAAAATRGGGGGRKPGFAAAASAGVGRKSWSRLSRRCQSRRSLPAQGPRQCPFLSPIVNITGRLSPWHRLNRTSWLAEPASDASPLETSNGKRDFIGRRAPSLPGQHVRLRAGRGLAARGGGETGGCEGTGPSIGRGAGDPDATVSSGDRAAVSARAPEVGVLRRLLGLRRARRARPRLELPPGGTLWTASVFTRVSEGHRAAVLVPHGSARKPHSARNPRPPEPCVNAAMEAGRKIPQWLSFAQLVGGLATGWTLTWSPQKPVLNISSLMPLPGSAGARAPGVNADGNSAVSHSEYPHSPFQDSEIPSPQLDRF